jgi:Sulfotransferase family
MTGSESDLGGAEAISVGGEEGRTPLLVFVHVPKTAGTILTSVLRMNEPRTRQGGNVFKGGGGAKRGVQFENLLDPVHLETTRVIVGHFPFGIRDHLPANREARFLTLLREPIDRTLSHYYAIHERRAGSQGASKLGLPPLSSDPTVTDMIEAGYIHDNVHTRMLSGLAEPFGTVDDEMLEQAKRNLKDEFAFFGLTERLDESLVLAKRRLGFRSILHRTGSASDARLRTRAGGRVNTTRPRGDKVSSELVRAAEACNRYDIELYRYAEELFDAAPERAELDFQAELAGLRTAKSEDGSEIEPAPAGFSGDDGAWRLLVEAKAISLRDERERVALEERVEELADRERAALDELERIRAGGEEVAGHDAETARRMIEIIDPARAKKLARATAAANADDATGGRRRKPRKRKRGAAHG